MELNEEQKEAVEHIDKDKKSQGEIIELNEEQKEAVEHIDSPLMIVAGPGSGKTSVIIERVKHLVKSGVKPEEILCLTFTNKATSEMESRLTRQNIHDVQISTFHAFAHKELSDNILESGISVNGGTLERSSQIVWGLENLDSFGLEHVKIGSNAEEVIDAMMNGISAHKNELITPEELRKYLDKSTTENVEEQDMLNSMEDLHKIYKKYQEFWSQKPLIDFGSMITEYIKLLKGNPHILKKTREKFKHILVDEFQDNNYAQLEIVKLIANDGNVTVVGDGDQSIFRFQGAYLGNFADYKKHFKNTRTVNLNQNYRSTQNIVELANSLVRDIPGRDEKKLFSKNIQGEKIRVVACKDESAETWYVVKTIKEMLKSPVTIEDGTKRSLSYEDFAILTRSRESGTKFVKALQSHGLPATFIEASDLFASSVIKDVMAYLNIVDSPATAGADITRLMRNSGITEHNIVKINHMAKVKSSREDIEYDFVFESLVEFHKNNDSQKKEIGGFISTINSTRNLSKFSTSTLVYKLVMSVSGLYKNAVNSHSEESRVDRVLLQEIYRHAVEYEAIYPTNTLGDFIRHVRFLFKINPKLPDELEAQNSITVSTIHSSKGREFQAVFVVDVAKGKLPVRQKTKKFHVPDGLKKSIVGKEDEKTLHKLDEKRLFYVAMTRAKSHLYITYAKEYESRSREAQPSEFLTDELYYKKNPLIECLESGDVGTVALEQQDKIEQIKHKHQKNASKMIHQMNLDGAIQKIADLAKIRYYQQNRTLDGFSVQELLKCDQDNYHIDAELYEQKTPLIRRDDFKLSPTSIDTYMQCPLKFKFRYVLRVPSENGTVLTMGSVMHIVTEQMTKMEIKGLEPTEEIALQILAKNWNQFAYLKQRTKEDDDKKSSHEMIQTYLKWVRDNKNRPVDVEVKFNMMINGALVSGKIDRVEEMPDGRYEVIDYKTGRAKMNKNSIKDDIQMNMYALGVEKLYGKLPARASLFYMKDDKIIPYDIEPIQINKFAKSLGQTIDAIFGEKFPASPKYQKCKFCEYRGICDEAA